MILRKKLLRSSRRAFLRSAFAAPFIIPSISRAWFKKGTSSGGGGYTAKAVHFDGNALLQAITALSASGVRQFLISYWVHYADINTAGSDFFFVDGNAGTNTSLNLRSGAIGLNLGVYSVDQSSYMANLTTAGMDAGVWRNVLWSGDTDHDAGSRIQSLYVTDVLQSASGEDNDGPAFDISFNCPHNDFSGFAFAVCASALDTPSTVADFADFQIYPVCIAQNNGSINQSERRNFISASGNPVDPTTAIAAYGAAGLLFSGDESSFPTNQGNWGAFTLTGTLTNATTSPSD